MSATSLPGTQQGPRLGRTAMPRALALATAAFALAGVVAEMTDSPYIYIERYFDRGYTWSVTAFVLMAVGWRRWPVFLRVLLAGLNILGGLILSVTILLETTSANPTVLQSRYPPGVGNLVVEVHRRTAVIDDVYYVTSYMEKSLDSRRHVVACFSGDDPKDAFYRLSWRTEQSIVVASADGRQWTISLDPDSGKPDKIVRVGCRS